MVIQEDVAKRRKQKGTLGNKPGNQFCLSLNFLSLVRETTESSKTYREPLGIVALGHSLEPLCIRSSLSISKSTLGAQLLMDSLRKESSKAFRQHQPCA